MAGEHTGHRQRMRERFLAHGLDGFADHEVLELVLFYAIPQRNVNPLAHELLNRFGSLHNVLEAAPGDLAKVEGIGEYAATLLSLFSHTARRLAQSRERAGEPISNHGLAAKHAMRLLCGLRQEHFYAVCLNAQMRLIADELISRGSIDEAEIHPRLVAEAVLRRNAHAVVLCHNHPGGSLIPSEQDLAVTRLLGGMLEAMGVALADHIIVAGDEALSMFNCGLLMRESKQGRILTRVADPAGENVIRARLEKQRKDTKA